MTGVGHNNEAMIRVMVTITLDDNHKHGLPNTGLGFLVPFHGNQLSKDKSMKQKSGS